MNTELLIFGGAGAIVILLVVVLSAIQLRQLIKGLKQERGKDEKKSNK